MKGKLLTSSKNGRDNIAKSSEKGLLLCSVLVCCGEEENAYPMPLKGEAEKHWPMVQVIMIIRVMR